METPDNPSLTIGAWDDLGIIKYNINVDESDSYRVWLRVKWTDEQGNSYAIDFDRETSPEWSQWLDDYVIGNNAVFGVWHWISKEFELTQGLHTLVLQTREDGVALDRLLITNDFSVTPS